MRTLIYTRVSTTEQVEKYGLDSQLRLCREYASRNDMQIISELAEDISGTIPIDERPKGKLIMEYVEAGKVDAVLMSTVDRTTRDERAIDFLVFRETLHENNIELHYADSGLDRIGTMEADIIGYLKAKYGGEDRKRLVKRMAEGKRDKALDNKIVMTGTPPYGYTREGKRESAHLCIDEREAQVVRQIFEWYVRGDKDGRLL